MLSFLTLLLSLALVVVSAEKMLDGAENISRHYHVSPWVLGFVVVGFGTSAPELMVSTIAAFSGEINIAVGNALGSNIANLALILGVTMLTGKVVISSSISSKQSFLLVGVTLLSVFVLFDHRLQLTDGLLLLSILFAIIFWMVKKKNRKLWATGKQTPNDVSTVRPAVAWTWLLLGLAVLLFSSEVSVNSAVKVARILGIDNLFIGLTIISLGTSLPELAVSMSAAKRGNSEMILGNIFGSNVFNALGVIGVSALINHSDLAAELFSRDAAFMVGVTMLAVVLLCLCQRHPMLTRASGTALLACYLLYVLLLYNHAFA